MRDEDTMDTEVLDEDAYLVAEEEETEDAASGLDADTRAMYDSYEALDASTLDDTEDDETPEWLEVRDDCESN
jgi:hypothetical protein